MISPYQLLQESGFAQYTAMIRIHYNRENTSLGAEKIAEMVRAIPGATRVSTVSLDKEHGIAIFNAKIISQKPPKEAYQALKQNALARYRGLITGLEIGANTIETKGDFIIKESDSHLNQWLRETLLEEGLLLEVSIEELRRQFVECDPPKLTAEVFDQIVQACNNKSNYTTWMCKKVADGLINTEDLQLWTEVFEFFDRYKQRFEKKDINQVKTSEDINNFLTDFNNVRDAVEAKKATGQTQKVKDETDQCLLGNLKTSDGQEWLVYKTNPGQWNLERKIGSGTSWCTVASQYYFQYYMGSAGNNDKAYYIFINKKNPKEKYQIHYGSNQCKDKEDHEVDYADEFVQDFYRYLEKVDGRTQWPRNAIQGKEKLERRKQAAERLSTVPGQVENLPHREVAQGKIYSFPQGKIPYLQLAAIFRDLGEPGPDCIKWAELFEQTSLQNKKLLVPDNGPWDLVCSERDYYAADKLASIRSSRSWRGNQFLPLATSDTIELYKAAAESFHNTVVSEIVQVRCNPNLPDLKSFQTKSEKKRTLYFLPASKRNQEGKAMLQAGLSSYYLEHDTDKDLYVYKGPEIEKYAVFYKEGQIIEGGSTLNRSDANSVEAKISIYEFAGLNAKDAVRDSYYAKQWMQVGQTQGFIKDIKDSTSSERPEGIPDDYEIGNSKALATLIKSGNQEDKGTLPFLHKKNDFNTFLVLYEDLVWFYKPAAGVTSVERLDSQKGIVESGIPVPVLVKFCQFGNTEVPTSLEKLYARIRQEPGVTTINVTRLLRDQRDHFQTYQIPYCTARWSRNRIYIEDGRGIFGSWEQLGPAIQESSPQHYQKVVRALAANPGSRADVFLHYNHESPNRSWNGVIRLINAENEVIWYARRYGNGERVSWSDRDELVDPQCRVNAGDAQGNYVASQPQAPRAPRGQRAAAEPATPAPEVAPEQQQQLEQYRQNIDAAQNVYKIPTNQTELIRALGFVNLATNVTNTQGNVVIYDVAAHRGNITRVALANLQDSNVVVVSLPGNLTYGQAQGLSNQWRSLTRILDNSIRTFQQCVDVCNQTHTPLPVGLQGWLAYRGVNNA